MSEPETVEKMLEKEVDTVLERRPGRPTDVVYGAVAERAGDYQKVFRDVWDELWPPLSVASSKEDVIQAFEKVIPGGTEFPLQADSILSVIRDKRFPKRPKAQITYLAESLAALGNVSFRRSRDICALERAKRRGAERERTKLGQIVRCEFYVECSCGYKGPSLNHACRTCGAVISKKHISFPRPKTNRAKRG
jgi:hypothetical protein